MSSLSSIQLSLDTSIFVNKEKTATWRLCKQVWCEEWDTWITVTSLPKSGTVTCFKEKVTNSSLQWDESQFSSLCGLVVRVPGYRYRGPGFDSRGYQIFWEVVGLERGPLSLVRSYLNVKVEASGLENRDYSRGDPLRWPRDTLYQLKLALTSAGCGCSVGIIRLRTKTTQIITINHKIASEEDIGGVS
jgi:hypothetical protein